ncbi:MAG: putative deoxyribonuclease [Acidimicrobiia bacterium]|nr:putative deoxyribonuclease [Acidimicrobiia bacterium]
MWTDSHCHLDDPRIEGGAAGALERGAVAGVTRYITVGTDADHSRAAIALAAQHDQVWATVGLHPHDAVNGVDSLLELLDQPKVVAVGECGLDYHYDHSPRDVQRRVFAEQIALAHQRQLALVIHTRAAWDDTFDVLRAEGVPPRTIFHCFSGGPDEARRSLDLGAYLSFSGIVSFKTAGDVRAAAEICPADRLMVETDSPYLAPVPRRGQTNEPANVALVGAVLAEVRKTTLSDIAYDSDLASAVAFGLPQS